MLCQISKSAFQKQPAMELNDKIISIIKDQCDSVVYIDRTSNLEEDLGIDSFGAIMIVNAIEDEISIRIKNEDLEKFKNVNDIVNVLQYKYLNRK